MGTHAGLPFGRELAYYITVEAMCGDTTISPAMLLDGS